MQSERPFYQHPYILLSLTALMWSGNAIAGKIANGHVSPFLLTWLRWAVACAILVIFAHKYIKNDLEEIKKHWKFLFFLGVIGFAIFNNLLYLSLTHTTAINVAIEQAAMPLIVFVLNYLIFKTKATKYQLIGFILTLSGVAITVTRGNVLGLGEQELNIGDIIMLVAITVYGIYSVFLKNKPDIHPLSFLSVLGFAAFLATTPCVLYEVSSNKLLWPDLTGWGVVIYAAIFASILSQLFWVLGLQAIGSNRGGVFINLVPIFAAILAIIILSEKFQTYHALGLILVLGGVTLAQRQSIKP